MKKLFKKGSKILYVFEYFPPNILGGAEISGLSRVKELSKDYSITVATPNYDNNKTEIVKCEDYDLIKFKSFRRSFFKRQKDKKINNTYKKPTKFQLIIFNLISILDFYFSLTKLLKQEKYDVLHANNFESNLGISLLKFRGVKVAYLRDINLFEIVNKTPLKPWFSYLIRKNDIFIAISKFIKKTYVERTGISDKDCVVEYNKIDKKFVYKGSKKDARKKLDFDSKKKYVLYCGALTELKGVNFIVEKIVPEFNDIQFVLIGEGYLKDEILKQKHKNLTVLGSKKPSEISTYLRAADLVLVPSILEEGYGRISVETQMNGTYVLVSDKGGLPETIKNSKSGKSVKLEQFKKEIRKFFISKK